MDIAGVASYTSGFAILAGIYAVFALGLNVHWGYTGLFNIGIAGFFALGAYTTALLTTASPDPALFEDFKFGGNLVENLGPANLGVDLWFLVAMLAAGAVCGAVALVIGFMNRKRHLFLATVKSLFKKQGQPGMHILTPHSHALVKTATPEASTPATAEDFLKKITELTSVGLCVSSAAKAGGTLPARWRLE